jgi:hypothetical protein
MRKVIASSELPPRLPIYPTLTLWLVLEKTEAAGWIWGATGCVMLFVWIACLIGFFTTKATRIWPDTKG